VSATSYKHTNEYAEFQNEMQLEEERKNRRKAKHAARMKAASNQPTSGTPHRIFTSRGNPLEKNGNNSSGTDKGWMKALEKRRKQRMEQTSGASSNPHLMDPYLQELVDIDGDGVVDVEEMALMVELNDEFAPIEVRDIDGDGVIDADELMVAKQLAGKKILAQRFVERNSGKMNRYGFINPSFFTMGDDDCAAFISGHEDFGPLMRSMKIKESHINLASSDQVANCLEWGNARHVPQPKSTIINFLQGKHGNTVHNLVSLSTKACIKK